MRVAGCHECTARTTQLRVALLSCKEVGLEVTCSVGLDVELELVDLNVRTSYRNSYLSSKTIVTSSGMMVRQLAWLSES